MVIRAGNMVNWIVVLAIAGYPVISFIPGLLGIDSTPVSIAYRAAYVLFSVLIISTLSPSKKLNLNLGVVMLMFFWIVYAFRLIWDLSVVKIPLYEQHDAFYFYSLAFGSALIPSIAVILGIKYFDLDRTIKLIYRWSIAFAVILVALLAFNSGVPFLHNGRLFANENLNSISTGHAGTSLAIVALSLLLNRDSENYSRTMLYISLFGGLAIALYSGSRSPLIVAVVVMVILMLRVVFSRHLNRKIFRRWILIVVLLISGVTFYVVPKLYTGEFKVTERLAKSGGGQEVRRSVWATAINQFVENPVLGDQFLERSNGKYPHNILLEAPMATGLLGGIPFFIMLAVVMIKSAEFFLNAVRMIPIIALFIQYFLWNITSGSLFGSGGLWILCALILAIPAKSYRAT